MSSSHSISPRPLTREAFAAFGDVIETEGRGFQLVNDGSARNFSDLAAIDVLAEGGRPRVNIFESNPLPTPIEISMMERHPLSSQAFIPLSTDPFLVVVSTDTNAETLHAFITNGRQGVNYRRNLWHHPLLVRVPQSRFIVIDRDGEGENCDILNLARPMTLSV